VRADNTQHLRSAARRRSQATRQRAIGALRRLAATDDPVTFESVARTAGVSRSWLYAQPDLRIEIGRLRAQHEQEQGRAPGSLPIPPRQRASDASLRRRLEAVNTELRRLRRRTSNSGSSCLALGERRAADVCGQADGPRNRKRAASTTIGPCS
jgi:hypothetical protein